MDPHPSSPGPTSSESPASEAPDATSAVAADTSTTDAERQSSLPVPVPEKPQSLWRRLSMRGGRRPILGTIDEQLELVRTRLEVVEEQLRSLGGALGRVTDRVGDRVDEAHEATVRTLGDQVSQRIDTKLSGIDQTLRGPFARIDEQLDSIGAALRSDLGRLDGELQSRVVGLGETVERVQREAAETAREDRDRIEGKLAELWEVGDQLTQIEELVERTNRSRDDLQTLAGRVQTLTIAVSALVAALVVGGAVAAAFALGWIPT